MHWAIKFLCNLSILYLDNKNIAKIYMKKNWLPNSGDIYIIKAEILDKNKQQKYIIKDKE